MHCNSTKRTEKFVPQGGRKAIKRCNLPQRVWHPFWLNMPKNCNWIMPNWPAPVNVKALTTVREGGVSIAPYDSFNLAMHVGDNAEAVLANRKKLTIDA